MKSELVSLSKHRAAKLRTLNKLLASPAKVPFWASVYLCFTLGVLGQGVQQNAVAINSPPDAWSVTRQDANSSIWERTAYQSSPNGQLVARRHRIVELSSGLNYQDDSGQWKTTVEQIASLPEGGSAAIQGPHKVYFPNDIYAGAITLVTPDGVQLQSRPAAIGYFDGTNSVLIGVLTNSVGRSWKHGHLYELFSWPECGPRAGIPEKRLRK